MSEPQQPAPNPVQQPAPEQPSQHLEDQAPIELPWRRLHPFSPLLRGGLAALVIIGIIIANLRDRLFGWVLSPEIVDAMGPSEGDLIEILIAEQLLFWALLAVIAVIAIVVLTAWLSWRFASFRITTEAVESRRGVIFRQHRRAPLERIQSVNLQRTLLARMLGLTQVDVQTAGQGGKVALQFLGHRDAQAVREQILMAAAIRVRQEATDAAHAQGQPDTPTSRVASLLDERIKDLADPDIDPAALEAGAVVKVPLGRLIASILLGSEMFILLIIAIGIAVSSVTVSPAILAGGLPLALVFIGIVVGQFNRGFNFVLSRADDGVRIGAGLTATTTETIPFGRIHAVEAQQPLGWRPFGWWKVRITTAGHSLSQGGQNRLQNTVLPVGELGDVLRVCETLLHEGESGVAEREAALAHALTGPGDGFLKAGPRAGWLLWFATRRTGLRVELAELSPHTQQSSLRIRRGWFTRSLSVMPIVRAQSVQLSRPLVHRILGLASLQVHTVLGPVRMYMRGIALADAREAFGVLASAIVRVQREDAANRTHQRPEQGQRSPEESS